MNKKYLKIGLITVLSYLFVSCLVYRFKHPEMTETQLILHIGDAIKFKD